MSVKINEQIISGVTAILKKKLQDTVVMNARETHIKY